MSSSHQELSTALATRLLSTDVLNQVSIYLSRHNVKEYVLEQKKQGSFVLARSSCRAYEMRSTTEELNKLIPQDAYYETVEHVGFMLVSHQISLSKEATDALIEHSIATPSSTQPVLSLGTRSSPWSFPDKLIQSKTSIEIGEKANDFVKAVVPFGANNKTGRDARAWKELSSEEYEKKYQFFTSRAKRVTSFYTTLELMRLAIHFGIGNCGAQACIAFIFLLSQGMTDVTQRYIDRVAARGDGHVFMLFRGSETEEYVIVDPWDNGTTCFASEDIRFFRGQSNPLRDYDLDFSSFKINEAVPTAIQDFCQNSLKEAINDSTALTTEEKNQAIRMLK